MIPRARLLAWVVLPVLGACRPAHVDRLVPPPPAALPPPPPSASAAPAGESPRLRDPRWVEARDEDPLQKGRLAVAVGTAGLLAGLADGGETAETALLAIPFADDAEIALGPLAEIARGDAGGRRKVLATILAVAGQPPRQREPLDLEGARRCGEVMVALARDVSVPRAERALAVSAARALAERGYVQPGRIPSDLDPESRYPRRP